MALGRNHKIFNIGNASGTIQGLTRVYHDLTLSGDGTLSSLLGVVGGQDDEEVNQYVYDNSAKINDVNSSYQTNSGNFLTAIPDYYATTGDINDLAQSISENYQVKGDYVERNSMASAIESATSGKLDASSFASVSSDFLVASSLNGYATESFVEETSGAITSLIPTNYYPDTNPSAFVNEDWVTAQGYITGVNISESATWNETSTTVQTNSSNWDNVSNKLDTTSFSNVSGTFLTAHQDLSNYYTKDETSGKEELANAFANIPVGDAEVNNYVHDTSATIDEVNSTVQSNSGNWNDISAYQNVSSTYLTAVDLTPYQTVEGMTAYQPAGDYATTADLAEKQDSLTFGYDEQDRINSINSSALAGGGEFPEDVMVESAIGYNAVNEISGYNGSAIAQYGAEKQWLQHDDTLVHAANSAQYALGVNLSAVAQLLGVDETVLWSGTEPTSSVSLSETWKNFDRLKIYVQNKSMDNGLNIVEVRPLERDGYTPYYNIIAGFSYGLGTNGMIWQNIIGSASDTGLRNCSAFGFQNSWTAISTTVRKNNANDLNCILKVIGIGRRNNT